MTITERYKQENQLYSYLYRNKYPGASIAGGLLRFTGKKYMQCRKILDAGCGLQLFAAQMNIWQYDGVIIGVDVSEYIVRKRTFHCPVIHTPIEDISIPNTWLDGLFCSDVLEHITQDGDKLVNSLKELRRVLYPGGLWGFSVCCEPSVYKGPNGEELHVTVKPPEWWIEILKKHGFEHILEQKIVQRWADKPNSLTILMYGR